MATGRKIGSARSKQSDSLAESIPISIIIPIHNAADFLPECLEALMENDLRGTEVIVVDDGSRDAGCELVRNFRAFEIKLLQLSRNIGPAGARNRGAAIARHPNLLFLDVDVVLPRDAICWLRESLDLYSHREEVIGVLGSYSEEASVGTFFTEFKNLNTCFLYSITETLSAYLHTPILLIEKPVFDSVGGFDERLRRGEDFQLGIVLGTRGYRFIIDRRIRAKHLKIYSFGEILREDWARIQQLRRIRLDGKGRRFALRAHRPGRLIALTLPGLVSIAGLMGFLGWISPLIALLLFAAFVVVNGRLLYYLLRHRGVWFAGAALAFLFLEMAWAELALVGGFFRR